MHRTCVVAVLLVLVCALWAPSHANIPHRPRSRIGSTNSAAIPLERTDDAGRWVYTPSDKPQRNHVEPRITDEEYRLPTNLRPTVYTIHLTPFIELIESGNFTTSGSTEIFFDCITPTNNITMNAAELTIDLLSIAVWDIQANNPIAVINFIDEQSDRQMITIQTAVQLEVGKNYKIAMKFTSILNDQKRGLYRSSYVENGVTKWLAVSDFESSDARRAFPCFDDPSMKARFSIVLGRKTSMTSASNMRQLATNAMEGMPGYVWDYYETSVPMSTYLVAFLVSEYVTVPSPPALSNIQCRIWTRPEAENLTQYAGTIGPKILEFFGDYFMIDYPLSKEDFVSVPDVDFTAGAMENWGLITYRESYLLIDVETAPETSIQRVAAVIAHELAHQWFGNLVTLEWWNAIWLNEGFASYFEYIGTNEVEPTFGMLDQFVIGDMHPVFLVDSVETSRPLHSEVSNPNEINKFFDTITYSKGSSIVRMMADFIGLETFNRGLTRYLTEKSYENANEDELWKALQDQIDIEGIQLPATVKEIMDTWTLQMGYPVITVTRNYSEATALFAQERFLSRKDSPNPTALQWWVPLTFRTGGKPMERTVEWLSKDEQQKSIPVSALNVQWVLVNLDQQNFYRVRYDEINYALLTDELVAAHANIPLKNRAQLLDDAFNLALANMIPYKHALDFSVYLKYEQEYVPWSAALSELNYIDIMLHNMKQYADWKIHMRSLVIPYYNLVGFEEMESDDHLTIYKRNDATSWACRLQVEDCVNHAKMHYANLMKDPNMVVSPNQRTQILRRGVENGQRPEWQFAFDQYKSTRDTTFLVAMTYTKLSDIIYEMLELMLDPNSGIQLADVNTLFSNIAANPLGNTIALNFLNNRWDDIEASWLGTQYFVSFFRSLCDRGNTQEELNKLEKLRTDHPDILGSSETVQQGIDVVKANINWIELHLAEIGTWLTGNPPASSPPTAAPTTTHATEPTIESTSESSTNIVTTDIGTEATSPTDQTPTDQTPTDQTPTGSAGKHHFYATPILMVVSLLGWMLVQ